MTDRQWHQREAAIGRAFLDQSIAARSRWDQAYWLGYAHAHELAMKVKKPRKAKAARRRAA